MAADGVAQKASATSTPAGIAPPKKGEKFHCEVCGMGIQVTSDCHCTAGKHVQFECCSRPMVKD